MRSPSASNDTIGLGQSHPPSPFLAPPFLPPLAAPRLCGHPSCAIRRIAAFRRQPPYRVTAAPPPSAIRLTVPSRPNPFRPVPFEAVPLKLRSSHWMRRGMGVDPRRVALEVVRAAVAIALLHAMMAELPPPGETTADNGGGGGGGGGVLGGEGRGGGGGAREGRILATAAHFPLPDNPRMPPSVPPPFSFPLNHFPPSAGLPPLELARSGGAGGSQGGVGRVSGECHVAEGQRVRADGGSDVRQEWQRAEAKLACDKPLPLGAVVKLSLSADYQPCSVFYTTVQNDTCESIAANFSLTASCLDPSQPCTTDLLSLNPGLDCSSSSSNYPLPTGLSICVKRSTPMVPLCRETVRVQGARSVTCASLLAKVKFPPSALELYRMNPGIYCHRLLPPSKDSGFPGSEVCVRLRAGMTMGSCPRSELYLATDNDSAGSSSSRKDTARLSRTHGTRSSQEHRHAATVPRVVWRLLLVSGLVSLLGFVSAPCAASDAAKRSESPDDTADDTVREWAMPQGKNLTLHVLADNTYGAKCLDGSPPGYFLRRGSGAGKEAWHIFLPGGGWCATAEDCAARATTAMGSTRPWTPRRKSARRLAVLFKGILSPVRRRNPNFYDWNLVVPLYCDGGGYAGRAGWKKVNDSTAIFMDGWRIMKAVLSDLMDQRGLNSATQVLLSGCSAGGQAVVMLCDQVETLLPSATVKCLMDGGFFLDARDRNDNLRFRSLVKRVTSLHQATGNARCGRAHEDEEKWRCFFPQYALGYIASTVYVVNPLFDYAALSIGNQLPNKTSSIARCLHDITVDMPSLTESIRNNSWTTMEFKENSPCTENEQKAVVTVAGTMYNEVKALVKKEPRAFHFPYESERERGVIAVGVMAAALATVSKAKDGSHVSLDGVRDKNVGQLRKLNAAMFPVKYQEKYYSDAMAAGEYTKLAFYSDVHVGAVACRLEREVGSGGGVKVYIMTLGVLAPYRRLGIGSLLLQHVLSQCEAEGSGVREVYLHVQTNNEDAIAFYSRFGFAITDTIKNYYRRLQPPDCYVLSRSFGPGAGATAAALQNGTAAAPGQ
ncbi:unnamed protein product [Closterium sp. NIES-65]|nr:unnamed protein product [Closterium sp. NIES-65]